MPERLDELRAELAKKMDESIPSPENRAELVWEILQKNAPGLTTWDLVCFAANYLGWQSAQLPWLQKPVKEVCGLVYTAHYIHVNTDRTTGLENGTREGAKPPPVDPAKEREGKPPGIKLGFDVQGGGFE